MWDLLHKSSLLPFHPAGVLHDLVIVDNWQKTKESDGKIRSGELVHFTESLADLQFNNSGRFQKILY